MLSHDHTLAWLDRELRRVKRHKRQLSVAAVTVDTRSNPQQIISAETIQALARKVGQISRTEDVVGMLDTRRLLVMLPETNLDSARIFARRCVQGLELAAEKGGTAAFLLRSAHDVPASGGVVTRWRIGAAPAPGEEDPQLINASKQHITMRPGGSFFHHADSFAMVRGGHIDICVLGAFQVSAAGDLANWSTGKPGAVPGVGGAMDLAAGAKQVFVMMNHLTSDGEAKIVERCAYPLTGKRIVTTIYSDLAVVDVGIDGLVVREIVDGLNFAELAQRTDAPLRLADDWRRITAPVTGAAYTNGTNRLRMHGG